MSGAPATVPLRFGPTEVALLAVVSLVWGAAYVFIREGLLFGASPLAFAAVRYGLSAAAFAALALTQREALPSRRAWLASASVGGVLIIGLYGGFLYVGEQYTTGGYAAVLASTAPLITVAAGFWLLASERLGRWGLAGIAIGFVGGAVLVLPQLFGSPLGDARGALLIVGAMVVTATGSVVLRRLGVGRQGLWQISTAFAVATILLGTTAALLPFPEALPLTSGVLGALAVLVVFSSVVGYFAYFALHHRVGPVRANVVAYLAPLVGVGIGSGLFGEPITLWEVAGVAIVLGGVSLVLWESSRRSPGPAH
jgi:drug/metabolite transporter (DMT)-like permease